MLYWNTNRIRVTTPEVPRELFRRYEARRYLSGDQYQYGVILDTVLSGGSIDTTQFSEALRSFTVARSRLGILCTAEESRRHTEALDAMISIAIEKRDAYLKERVDTLDLFVQSVDRPLWVRVADSEEQAATGEISSLLIQLAGVELILAPETTVPVPSPILRDRAGNEGTYPTGFRFT